MTLLDILGLSRADYSTPLDAEIDAAIDAYELQRGPMTDEQYAALERELDAIERAREERDCPYARDERLALRYYPDWLTLEQIRGK